MDELNRYIRQPSLARMWTSVKDKYERLGRIGGSVTLTDLSADENGALAGLFAANLLGRTEYSVRLQQLDQALRNSKFEVGLLDCLQQLFPASLQTRAHQSELKAERWRDFCDWARACCTLDCIRDWADLLASGGNPGYRAYLECHTEFSETGACDAWVQAVRALEALQTVTRSGTPTHSDLVRLPVFAANVTGDPHGLDRNTLAGKLFYWGLYSQSELTAPTGDGTDGGDAVTEIPDEAILDVAAALERGVNSGIPFGNHAAPSEFTRTLYAQAGILLDDVSSVVWVANWPGFYEDPVAVTLMNMERRKSPPAAVDVVYVVENPSVFATLVETDPTRAGSPMVCTSGQPSVAALRLLDIAVSRGAKLFYSGDFDVKGLQMAASLRGRYRDRLIPWHMDTHTYTQVSMDHLPRFTDAEMVALGELDVDWDERLIGVMRETGHKLFQEHILEQLLWDVKLTKV